MTREEERTRLGHGRYFRATDDDVGCGWSDIRSCGGGIDVELIA